MIKTASMTINGAEYVRVWSGQDMMIERNGVLYEEAIDPIDSGRTYIETDQPIIHEDKATIEDYLTALKKLGVSTDD